MSAIRADYLIQQRRAKEAQLEGLNAHIAADYKLRHKAQWEQKTDKVITQVTAKKRFEELRAVHNQQLETRRNKLRELYQREDEQYRKEYLDTQETPEDIRRRMAVRLEELKTIREKQRKEEVDSKMMQRWKESADELRTQDSQLTAMRCKIEQEHQMWEKDQKEKQIREENAIYDELWMREKIKKDQKELEELEKKEELNRQRLAYLNQQLAMREQNRKNQSQKDRDEKKMLNDEWEKEKQNEMALQREREKFMRERNLEIIQHNELTKQIKKDEEIREKELDKMLIAQIVQKERDQLEFEAQERRRHREEAKELQSHYKLRGQEEADLDRRIEEYANMESQQQWEEQERIWREREEARIKLLEEVYNNRADAIYERKRKEEEEKQREIEEKERIAREVAKAEEIDQMRKTALRMTKVNHQDNLKWQIDEKNERKKKELQEEMYEQRAAKLAEIQYKKMIEEEKKRGMQLLDELRAKRPF